MILANQLSGGRYQREVTATIKGELSMRAQILRGVNIYRNTAVLAGRFGFAALAAQNDLATFCVQPKVQISVFADINLNLRILPGLHFR